MKKNKIPHLIYLAGFTTATVVIWAAFSTYRAITSKPEPSVAPEIIAPFSAIIPEVNFTTLKNRVFFESSAPSPSSTASPTPEASPSPLQSASPSPTPSPSP